MAACVAILSLMRTLELEFLQPHPRPILQKMELIIPSNKQLIQSIHQNLGFFMELFDKNRMDGVEAIKELETKLGDMAFRLEGEIEFQIAHLYETAEGEDTCFKLGLILQQAMKDIDAVKEGLIQSLHQKLGFLISVLDENRMDGVEALKDLETKLRVRDAEKSSSPSPKLGRILQQAIVAIEEALVKIKNEYKLQETEKTALDDVPRSEVDSSQPPASDSDNKMVRKDEEFEIIEEKSTSPCFKLGRILQQIQKALVKIKNAGYKLQEIKKTALDDVPRSEVDSSQPPASDSENKMVGKDEEFKIIKKMLIQHSSTNREIVLIKGMGGIGKTTLARQIYRDQKIASHFDMRAWGVASQHYNKRQMLLALLNSMGFAESSNDDLETKLYQRLKGQRYLVVIDDVWSNGAWNDVQRCFPDDGCGSRVLITTRLEEVANSTCSKKDDFYHKMSFLNQSESWELFCKKAYKAGDDKFEMIGKQIVEKCDGLPLAIVMASGVLSKLNTVDQWKDIADSLNSFATIIDEKCSTILSFSYNHLPPTLKACFLYLGVFPEDYEINTNDLAKLWAAEGLVKGDESLDVQVDKRIQELVDRSLIIESKRSCCGKKVKAFTMHDVLHAFCVEEAHKEKLLYTVLEHGSTSPDQEGFRWVSIQSEDPNTLVIYPSLKNYCRSIFYFPFYLSETTTLNLKVFKLLRVLHFTSGSMFREIADLVHLRYLPPAVGQYKISKLSRAWNLQTLYIRVDDKRSYLEFPQLQYFSCFSICGHPPKFVHQNLQSICWMKPNHCTKEFFRNVPNLKKVRISGDRSKCNDCIENLAHLEQLERLNINAYEEEQYMSVDMIPINNSIALLSNLEKLTLRNTNFEWKGINILSSLPKLKVLKLFFFACVGEEWELEDEVFSQLIYLEINSIDLKQWKAGSHNFPELERLLLYRCKRLEEIPPDFGEIPNLKLIELKGCLTSVVDSAKQIETDQRDSGNDDMIVIEENAIQLKDELEADEDDFDEL
ncbi:disease resistance protein RPP13-like [Ipomoea triloba]|uniref:disease resistance protein RPP13-like n=1 Tax=Ipomoea triloba TaxID=35885 RepID=UPI00125D8E9B|nr:disease resistance protein RPP13-like [Ipomoea triloba]